MGYEAAVSKFAKAIFAITAAAGVLTAGFTALYCSLGTAWLLSAAITLGTTFYHFAMRLIVGAAVPKNADPDSWWFRSRPFEPRLYAALKVRRWKRHMPTYDPSAFSLAHNTPAQLLQNSCQAEIVHEIIILLCFVPVFTIPRFGAAGVFWSTSILAALFDSCFVVMQRYNRPRLKRILAKEAFHP